MAKIVVTTTPRLSVTIVAMNKAKNDNPFSFDVILSLVQSIKRIKNDNGNTIMNLECISKRSLVPLTTDFSHAQAT